MSASCLPDAGRRSALEATRNPGRMAGVAPANPATRGLEDETPATPESGLGLGAGRLRVLGSSGQDFSGPLSARVYNAPIEALGPLAESEFIFGGTAARFCGLTV
jgi:hypothetical protein